MKPASLTEATNSTDSGGRNNSKSAAERRQLPISVVGQVLRGPGPMSALIGTPRRRVLLGLGLFALVALGGAYFAFVPGPTPLDRLAFGIIPSEYTRHSLTYIADTGRPRVVAPGVVLCSFIAFFSDRRRALTCLVAPVVAIVITEYLAKPAVGRTFGGTLCYPSGHMTAVAALVCAFLIAVPARWRTLATVLGIAVGIVMGVTLMLLRWHYLTDVVAGAAVSIGSTLIVDAALHLRRPTPSWN
jgi:membrane-associated phospholipid phosphatase